MKIPQNSELYLEVLRMIFDQNKKVQPLVIANKIFINGSDSVSLKKKTLLHCLRFQLRLLKNSEIHFQKSAMK